MDTFKGKVYLTVIEEGSLSKAGIKLGYSTSGISQLMNSFEKEMGFPLLYRQKTGVTPTENGLNILPVIKNILKEEERLDQIKSEINGLMRGTVKIGAYSSVSTHWLPKIIKKFQEDYPNIEIKLMEGIRQEVDHWLKNKEVDIGFLSYKDNMSYDWIPLEEDPLLAVLPNNHPLATSINYPLQHISKEQFIMPGLGRDVDVDELFQKNKIEPNIAFTTLENFSAMALVEQGLGISVMNYLITKGWNFDVKMLPLDPPHVITLGIALDSYKQAAPTVKKFIKYTQKELEK